MRAVRLQGTMENAIRRETWFPVNIQGHGQYVPVLI
ncbi:hypothetical protein CLOBOL_00166 [Enterocloster bolteae ATCC BAA-613]|uniref:Uncharacterized protein n=1 Tax=Enterocloster bolteae (strain ATCC BAA-613 / DSM 15670 / CCUG 46953 / JCM 12243 / WAL 16351) TaxID=411902 RepID=A8RGL2_ENTBW|nr:hypothetical protein CLOBOL_00166 [Enterocloster bolteae ATCC BAA-613]